MAHSSASSSSSVDSDILMTALDKAPMHFIWRDHKSNQWQINSDVIREIEAIQGPVAIVTVAGPCRTGKV
jgi:hypothetical protein